MAFKRKKKSDKDQAQAWAEWLGDNQPADSGQGNTGSSQQPQQAQAQPSRPQQYAARPAGRSVYDRPTAPDPRYQPVPTPAMPSQHRPQPIAQPQVAPASPQQRAPQGPQLSQSVQYRSQAPQVPQNAAYAPQTNVNISIALPKLKKPTLPKLPYKKIAIWTGVVVTVLVISLVAHKVIVSVMDHRKEVQAAHALSLAKSVAKPTFTPLLPKGKSQDIGKTASFDGSRDTYSYGDTFNGTPLIVSQQPLPANFDSAQAAVTKIAKSLNATTPIISKVGTAYLSTDSKSGAQTIVFSNNGVLVFVQSSFNHAASDWKYYLDSLAK